MYSAKSRKQRQASIIKKELEKGNNHCTLLLYPREREFWEKRGAIIDLKGNNDKDSCSCLVRYLDRIDFTF